MRKVSIDDIERLDRPELAIPVRIPSDDPDVFLKVRIEKGTELKTKHVERLREVGHHYVFVNDARTEDLNQYRYDENVEQAQNRTIRELKKLTDNVKAGNFQKANVSRLRDTVRDLVEAISETDAMMAFTLLKGHDDYTAKHSFDVCKLAIHFALEQRDYLEAQYWAETASENRRPFQDLVRDIGVGGILHDIGKWEVPQDILNKSESLTDQEWEAIKRHPVMGRDVIDELDAGVSSVVQAIVEQHHEQYGGKGYPEERSGHGINLLGRLVAPCDVYSALTSDRSYRVELTPRRAREEMQTMQQEGDRLHFDPEIFERFLDTFPPFPVGQEVILSNGNRGIVCEYDTDSPDQPIVRVLEEGGVELSEHETYEIVANRDSTASIVN